MSKSPKFYVIQDRVTGSTNVGEDSSTQPSPKIYKSFKEAEKELSRIKYERDRYLILGYLLHTVAVYTGQDND